MREEGVVEYLNLSLISPRRAEENQNELRIGGITAGIQKRKIILETVIMKYDVMVWTGPTDSYGNRAYLSYDITSNLIVS
jgi:hypothetical protein